jgi:hypothetical protein
VLTGNRAALSRPVLTGISLSRQAIMSSAHRWANSVVSTMRNRGLSFFGLGGEQRYRVSGLRLGGVLGGRQPLEFEGVPPLVVDESTP